MSLPSFTGGFGGEDAPAVKLRALAPAKVNLCLFLGPRRPRDGRHELVTLFESISLADELQATVLAAGVDEVACPGIQGPNLVDDAVRGLRAAGWAAPPVRIEIDKRIPVAAGLGGGSADAAAALRLAGELEPLADGLAERVARQLGADVPSQLVPGLALGTGAGEVIEPLDPLAVHAFLIVPQPFGLSTAEVYAEADRLGLPRESLDGVRERVLAVGDRVPDELAVNDLEPAALSLRPEIGDVLVAVRKAGADQVLVCGSGPTVAGVFWGSHAPGRAAAAASELGAPAMTAAPIPSAASGTIHARR